MKRRHLLLIGLFCLMQSGGPAPHAQVSLPVPVPTLPKVGGVLDESLNRTTNALDPQVLRTLRQTRIRALVRNNREIIETDPRGAPILRNEVVAIAPTAAALEAALAAGFSVARESKLDALDLTVVVLKAPAGLATRRALRQLREADPQGSYDYNHLYLESGRVESGVAAMAGRGARANLSAAAAPITGASPITAAPSGDTTGAAANSGAGVRVGLIDSGVDATHPVFHATTVIAYGCNGRPVADPHGTAVGSLIAGDAEKFRGAAARATLYAADVYCGVPSGGSIDAILDALGWMARERVPVVNVSLVGPPNVLLENVTRRLVARGHLLVAAVGNDGPAAKPLYPAAYPGVIGVTAVDPRQRVLLEACRGQQVDFAAPGSDIAGASPGGAFRALRGTSFAAPIVSALLASRLTAPDGTRAVEAARELTASATDLGSRGRDTTYGDGLVGETLRQQFAAALANKSNANK